MRGQAEPAPAAALRAHCVGDRDKGGEQTKRNAARLMPQSRGGLGAGVAAGGARGKVVTGALRISLRIRHES